MNPGQLPLSGFENRLLAELRRVVVVDAPSSSTARAGHDGLVAGRFARRRRLTLVAAGAAATAIAVVAGLLIAGGTPAYAVTTNTDGTVTVEINALRDAEGLERQLHEAGVPAAVQYLPPGKACKEPTFEPVAGAGGGGGPMTSGIAMKDTSVQFTIDRSSLLPGQTLVIYTQDLGPGQSGGTGQGASSVAISVAKGEVKPCELVDGGAGVIPTPVGSDSGAPSMHVERADP